MINDFITFTDATGLFKERQPKWSQPPCVATIEEEAIHLWQMELDIDDHMLCRFRTFLSADERDRAEKFRFEIDRKRFIARKGAQRTILARYFGVEPKELQFRYTAEGKPFLECSQKQLPIQFSATSSDSLGLLAVAYNRRIGVDVENRGRTIEYEEIASSFFSPLEAEQIKLFQENEQADAFLACWTVKEAYLKAVGTGLSFSSLRTVSVPFQKRLIPSLFHLEGPMMANNAYTGVRFNLAENYIATLLVERR